MRPPPYYTPTDTLFPYPPVFRSPARASPLFSPSANPYSRSHPKEMTMADAYIVEAVRTAGARRNGALAGWHPADMAGEVLNALVDRTGIDPAAIDDVIMGCVTQAGEQANHVGRMAVQIGRASCTGRVCPYV